MIICIILLEKRENSLKETVIEFPRLTATCAPVLCAARDETDQTDEGLCSFLGSRKRSNVAKVSAIFGRPRVMIVSLKLFIVPSLPPKSGESAGCVYVDGGKEYIGPCPSA